MLRFCAGGSASGRATAARRPGGRLHFVGTAHRDVLLADGGGGGIRSGRKAESLDRNLAGKYWPDHPCHYFAAADGAVARRSWLASQGQPAGNLETFYAPAEDPGQKTCR